METRIVSDWSVNGANREDILTLLQHSSPPTPQSSQIIHKSSQQTPSGGKVASQFGPGQKSLQLPSGSQHSASGGGGSSQGAFSHTPSQQYSPSWQHTPAEPPQQHLPSCPSVQVWFPQQHSQHGIRRPSDECIARTNRGQARNSPPQTARRCYNAKLIHA